MYYSTDPDKAIECTLKYREDFRKIRNQFGKATNYLKGFKQFEEGKKYRYSCRSSALLHYVSALGGYPSGGISGQVLYGLEEYQKRFLINITITKLSEDEILVEDGELVNNRRLAYPGSYFKKEENTFLIENPSIQLAYRAVSKDRVLLENSTIGRFANKEVYAPIKAKSSFDSVSRAVVQYVQCDRIR
ncbi:MAG: hypothetical protein WD512_16690 [Candidatus Paceibacterota bacterium]